MIINSLRERIQSYEDLSDYRLLKRLPVITIINGRSFKKTTSLLHKPYDQSFMETMCGLMLKLCCEIEGSVFAYSFNDEILVISRNDQNNDTEAWCDNKLQRIVSCIASISTVEFLRLAHEKSLNLIGDPIFTAKTFVVPNITEAINVLIAKQQQAFHSALYSTCFFELTKKYPAEMVRRTLFEKTPQEKSEMLLEQCGIDFNTYAEAFRKGAAAYRAQKIVHTLNGDEMRQKLIIDSELPVFTKAPEFLVNILKTGKDIVRL